MRYDFTEQDLSENINKMEIEDLLFIADYIEGSGKTYRAYGSAIIDGETYHEFCVEFELESEPSHNTAAGILACDWLEYDFVFDY